MTGVSYDAAGNQTSADNGGKQLLYDGENRLVEVKSTGAPVTTLAKFEYDGEGRRVRKIAGGVTTVFAYDGGGELIAEYGGTVAAGTPQRQYLVADHLGSTRMIVGPDGSCVQRMDYAPFGGEIPRTEPCYTGTAGVAQKFTGKERDAETGLDYFGARYFGASQARFTASDPHNPVIESRGQVEFQQYLSQPLNWNRYSYARSNPLKYLDPDGRETKLAVGRQTQDNPFGHVAIIINDKVYSYGTNYNGGAKRDWGASASTYLSKQANLRETDLLTIKVSDQQEQQLEQILNQNNPNDAGAPPYDLIGNSCVTQCERALVKADVVKHEGPGPVFVGRGGAEFQRAGTNPTITPQGLADRIHSQGQVASISTVGQQQVGMVRSTINAIIGLFR
jgi:RHS repeat-associated protein